MGREDDGTLCKVPTLPRASGCFDVSAIGKDTTRCEDDEEVWETEATEFEMQCGPENQLYGTEFPVGPNQLLLRGSIIRNTRYVVGVVTYTGRQSKVMMNARHTPSK